MGLTSSSPGLTLFSMIVGKPIPFEARTKLRIPLASVSVLVGRGAHGPLRSFLGDQEVLRLGKLLLLRVAHFRVVEVQRG